MAALVETVGKAKVEVTDGLLPMVILTGEVNYEASPLVRDVIRRLADNGHKNVELKCPDASFIDSSGIGALVNSARELRKQGGGLKLLEITRQLRHALEISGFLPLFDISDTFMAESGGSYRLAGKIWQSTRFSIPASADSDGTIRHRITEMARSMPFDEEAVEDIQLAVGEAVANAYRHGIQDRDNDKISVQCVGDETGLTVEITNPGPAFDPDSIPPPDPSDPKEGGMGIFFMRQCMDTVEFIFNDTGTTVKMIKLLGNQQGGIVDNNVH